MLYEQLTFFYFYILLDIKNTLKLNEFFLYLLSQQQIESNQ